MALDRRTFGINMLKAAAALGVRSIGSSSVMRLISSGSALGAGACGTWAEGNAEIDATTAPLTHVHSDIVIVGSGYGGAVTAKRLTERGASVLMLEMGQLWNTPAPQDGKVFCSILAPDGRALWFRDNADVIVNGMSPVDIDMPITRMAGALDVIESPEMKVYCGRGVGGGSLVNMAMLVTPPQDILQRVLPGVDSAAMLETYYPRALQMLRGNSVRRDFWEATPWYQYSRVGYAAAQNAGLDAAFLTSGYDYAYMEKEAAGEVPASACNYEAGFGNNYGKQSLDKNYIADALATGRLTLESLHIVKDIRRDGDLYVLSVNAIDVSGRLVARKEITCKHLFMCGGSMGTSEMLVRARETGGLPDLNIAVGTGWGPNSDIFVMRSNNLITPTGENICTVPATGFRTRDQDGKHVFSMDIPFPVGTETFISFNIVMTENPESGTFRYDPVLDKAVLDWKAGQNAPAVKSARFVFDKLNVANGSDYQTAMFRGKEFQDQLTYHPVGGCPLGEATDDCGRVHGYTGLYVLDGSLIPRGLLANPALTVAALAERNIERIAAADLGL